MHSSKAHTCSRDISVCHVAVADIWAGAEVQLQILLSRLVLRPDLTLSVILFNRGRLEKEIIKLGIPVTVFDETKWRSVNIFFYLLRQFKNSNIQLVHTHKYKDTILTALAAKLCGIPHVDLEQPFGDGESLAVKLQTVFGCPCPADQKGGQKIVIR